MRARPFLRFPGFRAKALTLSYDDANVFDKQLMEIIDRYGIKCTFNVCSGWLNRKPGTVHRKMYRDEAVELYANTYHEIACHGAEHLMLAGVSPEMATSDIVCDRLELEKIFGRIIKGMAYANGSFDDKVVEILRNSGIEYARTTISTESFGIPDDWLRLNPTCKHTNPKLMELAEKFMIPYDPNKYMWARCPELFYLWGHSYEFNDNQNWEILENFCKVVGNHEEMIWYATNGEIVSYVNAYDALRFSADGRMVQNPTCTELYLSYFGNDVIIPAGATVLLQR